MSEIQERLNGVLLKTAEGLRTGNTHLDEPEMEFLLDTFNEITSPDISTYTAIKISGYSKSEFYKLVSDGLLPKGYHVQVAICNHYGVERDGEDAAWLQGYLMRESMRSIIPYMCD